MTRKSISSKRLGMLLLGVSMMAHASASFGQTHDPAWLRSIDELMDVEVSSASRRDRRLSDTAAAAFVLTRDDIRRSGLTDVPSLLRLVPGVQVAQIDGNKWAVTVRGFNSRWANKLLVMIDGQSVYSDIFSGVYWDALDVPVDSIERIEVVRGPGGSLWGANAVNGIINIITRAPTARGGAVSATLGSFGLSTGALRYGSPLGSQARYHAYVGGGDQDAVTPDMTTDNWNRVRLGGGFAIDLSERDNLDFQVAAHHGGSWSTSTTVVSSIPLRRQEKQEAAVSDTLRAVAKWTRSLGNGGTLQSSASWMRVGRSDSILTLDSDVVELSLQHAAGRKGPHEVTWGATLRRSDNRTKGSATFDITPDGFNQSQNGVFMQDDVTLLRNQVVVTLGAKAERFTQTGWHWQPTARALWHVSSGQSVWAAASRAVRTPSISERGMFVNMFEVPGRVPMIWQLFGNPALQEESMVSYELGYRFTAPRISLDAAAYRNRYDDAVNLEIGTPHFVATGVPHLVMPVVFDNKLRASTAGGELLLTVSPISRWRLVGTYALFTVASRLSADSRNFADAAYDAATPRHQGTVRSLFALPHRLDAEATLYWAGRITSDAVPSYRRIDGRLGWRVLPTLDVALHGRNLLDSRHVEFKNVSGGVAFGAARRQISVLSTWRF